MRILINLELHIFCESEGTLLVKERLMKVHIAEIKSVENFIL